MCPAYASNTIDLAMARAYATQFGFGVNGQKEERTPSSDEREKTECW